MAQGYNAAAYEKARRGVEDQYAAESAQLAYSRTLSQQRGSRALGDMETGFRRELPSFQAGFAQRGLAGPGVRSGAYTNALQRYVGDYQQNYARAQQDLAALAQHHNLQQANLDAMRQRALADLEMQKQADIALAALNIQALAPLIGG